MSMPVTGLDDGHGDLKILVNNNQSIDFHVCENGSSII